MFEGIQKGCVAWADYNRDRYTDLVISGKSAEGFVILLYENKGD